MIKGKREFLIHITKYLSQKKSLHSFYNIKHKRSIINDTIYSGKNRSKNKNEISKITTKESKNSFNTINQNNFSFSKRLITPSLMSLSKSNVNIRRNFNIITNKILVKNNFDRITGCDKNKRTNKNNKKIPCTIFDSVKKYRCLNLSPTSESHNKTERTTGNNIGKIKFINFNTNKKENEVKINTNKIKKINKPKLNISKIKQKLHEQRIQKPKIKNKKRKYSQLKLDNNITSFLTCDSSSNNSKQIIFSERFTINSSRVGLEDNKIRKISMNKNLKEINNYMLNEMSRNFLIKRIEMLKKEKLQDLNNYNN